jgi:hypothetical protein
MHVPALLTLTLKHEHEQHACTVPAPPTLARMLRVVRVVVVGVAAQRRLREVLRAKEQRVAAAARLSGGASNRSNRSVSFSSEEIMVTNLECVRPCYANNASGVGALADEEIWHDESRPECRNIYFTPLVHSM